jgi:hypothetical protein
MIELGFEEVSALLPICMVGISNLTRRSGPELRVGSAVIIYHFLMYTAGWQHELHHLTLRSHVGSRFSIQILQYPVVSSVANQVNFLQS